MREISANTIGKLRGCRKRRRTTAGSSPDRLSAALYIS